MDNMIKMLNDMRYGYLKPENLKNRDQNITILINDIRAYSIILEFVLNNKFDQEDFPEQWIDGYDRMIENDDSEFFKYFELFEKGERDHFDHHEKYCISLIDNLLNPDPELGMRIIDNHYEEYSIRYNEFRERIIYVRIMTGRPYGWDEDYSLIYPRMTIIIDEFKQSAISFLSEFGLDQIKIGLLELKSAKKYFLNQRINEKDFLIEYSRLYKTVNEVISWFDEKIKEIEIKEVPLKIKWNGTLEDFVREFIPLLDKGYISLSDYSSKTALFEDLYKKFYVKNSKKENIEIEFSSFKQRFDKEYTRDAKYRIF